MTSFFAMGGYAAFIWPAYGSSAVALAARIWQCVAAWRAAKRRLDDLERERP